MTPENTDFSNMVSQNSVVSIGFWAWTWSKLQSLVGWFYPNNEEYPTDEAGSLIRRHMEQKSWFDKISSSWNEKSFLLKITYVSLFILASSFLGTLIGASLTFTISAVLLSIFTHKLLVSHEQNRWSAARIFAAETMALNRDLRATQAVFDTAIDATNTIHEELTIEVDTMREQGERLDPAIELLQRDSEVLAFAVDDAENETRSLLRQQKVVFEEFVTISEDLDVYHKEINHSKEIVGTFVEAASQFSGVVTAMHESQVKFSAAVDTICFFAKERSRTANLELETENNDEFIAALMRQVAINDAIIDRLEGSTSLH